METSQERLARITAPPEWRKARRVSAPKAERVEERAEERGSGLERRRASYFNGLLAKYNLSRDKISQLLYDTCGLCPICGQRFNPKDPVLDHDHQTGLPRAFLCIACNSGLGFFRDSPEIMRRAARYVKGTLR